VPIGSRTGACICMRGSPQRHYTHDYSVTQGKLLPTKAYEIIVEDRCVEAETRYTITEHGMWFSPLAISSRSFSVLERNKAFPHYACQRRTPLTRYAVSPNDALQSEACVFGMSRE
jgi:hypothetical protein